MHSRIRQATLAGMADWLSKPEVVDLAYQLAETVRRENRSERVAAESDSWRIGVERLVNTFPGMTEDDANLALNRGMIDTAM